MKLQKQPLLILVICFILGILFQEKMVLTGIAFYLVIVICLIILSAICFHSYFLHKIKAFLMGLLFFGAGIILHFHNTFSADVSSFVKKKETVTFTISQKLNTTAKYKKYEGAAQAGGISFNSVLYVPKDTKELDFLHYYKAEAYITHPKAARYDFQFDYAGYLKRKHIDYQIYLSKDIVSAERDDVTPADKLKQYRFIALKNIDETGISGKTKEFLKGIILADRTEIDAGTVQDFNKSGLVHFLAISGTHIVVVFGMFYFLLIRCIPLKFRKYAVILSLFFIWLFAAFIGFGNSVLRSCIMLSIYFIFVLLQRKPDLLHSLALSAFLILIGDTQQLFDVGFQLSFLAVLGIYWLNQPLLKYFPKQDNYLKKLLFNTITISLSAQLATLPLVLYYFHQFSFISIIANIVIVPFSEIIIVFSFIMTAFISCGVNFEFLNRIYDFIIQILLKMIHWFAEVDMLFFDNIPMNGLEVLSVFVVVYLLKFPILKFNVKNSSRLMIAVVVFLMIRAGSNVFENQKEEVLIHTFGRNSIFSIKRGDEACFWISDTENKTRVLQFVVNPYCSSRRISHFELKTFSNSVQKVVFRNKIYDLK
ncbi:ComEC family competence protein (plasmid) [Chryseobacterium panacisoli]|uniref:ComEC family competence protein n=1 Tax=Chryseobacterium panacisoli TaxID=1807141 RepID=A0A5D9A048_9FLAO|nr:ComEC/Rec2 family competence protein [Chryseobacterium panacisoli]TZG00202.1 ComEC family competence protein [Chryseobacterium panacisoli]